MVHRKSPKMARRRPVAWHVTPGFAVAAQPPGRSPVSVENGIAGAAGGERNSPNVLVRNTVIPELINQQGVGFTLLQVMLVHVGKTMP